LENCIEKENYKNNEVFRVLHVGRFMEQKNHVGLIEAFSIFHKKFQNSVLELIGEGEKKQEIERLVNEKGLLNCIYFLGAQDNVYQYLNRADVFVLPSLYEGVPMTLIEAMGTGLPIIATNVGGIPNMLQNGKNALLVENDIEQIVESLVFFANSEKNRKGFGQNAKIEAKRFSVKIMAENYLEIYKEKIR
jgi:glycosyltransferase involved in cell wall biosynthesis